MTCKGPFHPKIFHGLRSGGFNVPVLCRWWKERGFGLSDAACGDVSRVQLFNRYSTAWPLVLRLSVPGLGCGWIPRPGPAAAGPAVLPERVRAAEGQQLCPGKEQPEPSSVTARPLASGEREQCDRAGLCSTSLQSRRWDNAETQKRLPATAAWLPFSVPVRVLHGGSSRLALVSACTAEEKQILLARGTARLGSSRGNDRCALGLLPVQAPSTQSCSACHDLLSPSRSLLNFSAS